MEPAEQFDPAALARVRRLGGDVLVQQLVTVFLEHAPTRVAALHAALAAGDREGAGRAAHALRGSAANVGALELTTAAAALESAAPGHDDLAPLAAALDAAWAGARDHLRALTEASQA